MFDRIELMRRAANEEELTEEETLEVKKYVAELSTKLELDPEKIYKHMWRGVPKSDRRPSQPVRTEPKIGRNDTCPCDSGIKYKKCCGK